MYGLKEATALHKASEDIYHILKYLTKLEEAAKLEYGDDYPDSQIYLKAKNVQDYIESLKYVGMTIENGERSASG